MNKRFKSRLEPLLEQYLDYRRSIGFESRSQRSLLRSFDVYMDAHPSEPCDLKPAFFLAFKQSLDVGPSTRNQKITAVRGFFEFLVRRQIVSENPLKDIPSDKQNAFMPFVFSPEQTENLLDTLGKAIRKDQLYFFIDLTVYTAILLIARCGLRISEPTRLCIVDYNRREGSIYIEKTKFNKDRLIPVPRSCLDHMENYINVRKSLVRNRKSQFFLPGPDGRRLSKNRIYNFFRSAIETLGIYQPKHTFANMVFGAPTPHCLRHSFAINTLKNIKARGGSPQDALPVLAAYLGHRKYRYTAVYLKFIDAEQRGNLVDFSIHRQEEI